MIYSIKFSEIKKKAEKEIIDEIYSQNELIDYLENDNQDGDSKLTNIKDENIQLSKIKNDTVLFGYLDAAYREAMNYIGIEANSTQAYMEDLLDDCYIEVKEKENNEILRSIRDDILNELRKEINYRFFGDKDMD